jgi:type II secretory pathway pseudopilin PulG
VLAVVVILVAIGSPAIFSLINFRDENNEQRIMSEIADALQAYSFLYGEYPDDDTTGIDNPLPPGNANNANGEYWHEELARLSNLSPNQIRVDVWNNNRMYVRAALDEQLQGADVQIHYASVHAFGPNQEPEGGANIPLNGGGDDYAAATNTNWWGKLTGGGNAIRTAFAALQPAAASDDLMIKVTNRDQKMKDYETSLQRVNAISDALAQIADERYNLAVAGITSTSATQISSVLEHLALSLYFPRSASQLGADLNDYYDASPNYGDNVPVAYSNNIVIANNAGTDAARRGDGTAGNFGMVGLMRILGLPDSYCCTPLFRERNGGAPTQQERAYYYYANPGVSSGGACIDPGDYDPPGDPYNELTNDTTPPVGYAE